MDNIFTNPFSLLPHHSIKYSFFWEGGGVLRSRRSWEEGTVWSSGGGFTFLIQSRTQNLKSPQDDFDVPWTTKTNIWISPSKFGFGIGLVPPPPTCLSRFGTWDLMQSVSLVETIKKNYVSCQLFNKIIIKNYISIISYKRKQL